MRIISGRYRGRALHPPHNLHARPTTDFAKESLFNILNNYFDFEKINVLDLFAGSGNISYEFASRNSPHIDAIEKDTTNFSYIQQAIRDMKLETLFSYKTDVFRYLKTCHINYDIIFADPPYDMDGIEKLPNLIFENNLLKPDGWFILEHSQRKSFENSKLFREERHYGNVHFSFFY